MKTENCIPEILLEISYTYRIILKILLIIDS